MKIGEAFEFMIKFLPQFSEPQATLL